MRPSVRILFITLCLALIAFAPALAGLQSIAFGQASFTIGANSLANSDWGLVDITYDWTTSEPVQYLNLVVDGRWEVQNAPLFSSPVSTSESLSLNFNLGNTVGNPVPSVNYLASVGTTWLDAAPVGTTTSAAVSAFEVTVGGRNGALGPVGSASSWVGTLPVDFAFNWLVDNQDCGVDECSPTAFSNSLRWLDRWNDSISIPEDKKSIEGLKGPTKWKAPQSDAEGKPIPGTGGTPLDDWAGKRDALKEYVTTRKFPASDLSKVLYEIRGKQDVELLGMTHAAVVKGIVQNLDGTYTVYVSHDTQQGKAGGTKTQPVIVDPRTGKFASDAFGFAKGAAIDGFVVECPVPEPVFFQFGALIGLSSIGVFRLRKR